MLNPAFIGSVTKVWLLNAVVAVVYFGLGLFGLLFKVSGLPFSAVTPSAGLALASMLLYGKRILPGIFIGSFFVNAWVYAFAQNLLWLYFAIALGDCLAALLGSALLYKFKAFPDPLDTLKKLVHFMAISGPVSSLAPAAISVYLLRYYEIIHSEAALFVFFINWLGYSLGSIIFTPLFLIIMGAPQSPWRRRIKTVGLPVIASFALVTVLFFHQTAIDRRNQTERDIEHSMAFAQAISNRIELNLLSLQALNYYLLASKTGAAEEFATLSRESFAQLKEITALRWLDTADKPNSSRLIARLDDTFFDLDAKNEKDYLPLASRKQLLNNLTGGEKKFLILEENAILLAAPASGALGTDQRQSGLLLAELNMKKLIDEIGESVKYFHFNLAISAVPKTGLTEKLIFSNTGVNQRQPYYVHPVTVSGQTWKISFFHQPGQSLANQLWPAFWIMITGMGFTALLGLTLLYHTGRNLRTEAIIDDRTQKLIQTKTSAEAANKAKSQFLAKISHELRTPLNGISGFVQLLEKNRSLNQEAKHQLAIIKQCATGLLTLINEILDTSSIENESFKIRCSDFDFASMFDETLQICKIKADNKGIKLITCNDCKNRMLHGDEKRIRQILSNLVDNAIKYTRDGSVKINAAYENGCLTMTVADTGNGIANDDLDRIFLPFVQVHEGESVLEGVGLGLFIIKELINLMEGSLSINSQPGAGSVFRVVLPMTSSEAITTLSPSPPRNNLNELMPVRVLVVDDSEINLLFLSGLLDHIGCRTNTATNGYEALSLLECNQYDLALIDINMPLMNGIELVKKIRALKINLKIAVVSAYADEEKISEATAAGIDAYLTKPVDENRLIELIQADHNPYSKRL